MVARLLDELPRRLWLFAACTMLGYAALAAAVPTLRGLDLSVFVSAGDGFVDAAQAPAGLMIRHASDGYDGSFTTGWRCGPGRSRRC